MWAQYFWFCIFDVCRVFGGTAVVLYCTSFRSYGSKWLTPEMLKYRSFCTHNKYFRLWQILAHFLLLSISWKWTGYPIRKTIFLRKFQDGVQPQLGFGSTGIISIRSADPENPTLKPNMKLIGWPVAEISPTYLVHVHFHHISTSGRHSSDPHFLFIFNSVYGFFWLNFRDMGTGQTDERRTPPLLKVLHLLFQADHLLTHYWRFFSFLRMDQRIFWHVK